MNLKKLMLWLGGVINYGLLSDLVKQPNNQGQKSIRLNWANSSTSGVYIGSYNPASTYNERDRVGSPSDQYFTFRAKQAVPAGEFPNPNQNTDYWAREIGVEIIQDLGNGSGMYYSIDLSNDDTKKLGQTKRVTLGAQGTAFLKYSNATPAGIIGPSASSITMVAAPSVYSLTVAGGISSTILFAPVSLGASSTSITIGSSVQTPVFQTIQLATGLTLVEGDKLKGENSSTNFIIATVIDYDSVTGIAYCAVINGVGSGTYTSWTFYKVALIFASLDSAPTSFYFHAIVESYDSGTGVISCRTFVNTGSGVRTTWTVWQGRQHWADSGSGTMIHQQNQVMGQCFQGKYYGNTITHISTKRTSACGVRYIITDGPNAGDEYTIDLYNATTVTNQLTVVASDLATPPPEGYSFIAFFIASPSSGTNTQATLNYSYSVVQTTASSFIHRIIIDTYTVNNPICGGGFSSGEFAFNYRKAGTADTLYWLWDHNLIDGLRYTSNPVFRVDGVIIDTMELSSYDGVFQNFNSFTLTQIAEVFHPDQVSKMADITITHGFDGNGIYWDISLTLSQNWEISSGYVDMIAFPQAAGGERWFNKFLTDLGGTFTWPGGSTPVGISGTQLSEKSALYYSTQNSYANNTDYVLAQYHDDNIWGASGNEVGYSGGPKQYPLKYSNFTINAGEIIRVRGRQFAGNKGDLVLS